MVVALLVFLAATVTTGLMEYAAEDGAGALAPLYTQSTTIAQPMGEEREGQGEEREGASGLGQVHETLANITLGLIVLHVLGVLLASFAHRENLVGAMISGRKRSE